MNNILKGNNKSLHFVEEEVHEGPADGGADGAVPRGRRARGGDGVRAEVHPVAAAQEVQGDQSSM